MAAMNDLVFKNWSVSDKTNTLNVRLFRGVIGFSVFPKQRVPGNNQPLCSCNLDERGEGYEALLDVIDQVLKAPLGTKIPMSRTKFEPQTRQRTTAWVISFEKDQDMCYWITLTDCEKNASFKFPISISQSFTYGNDAANKAQRSATGMRSLLRWLKNAYHYAPLTAEKAGPRGAGGPRPAASTPAPAAPAAGGGYSDDIPF